MWVVFFNKFSDLDILARELKQFERFYSPSDGVIFRSRDPKLPISFSATESESHLNLFDWVYKSFQPQVIISSGTLLGSSQAPSNRLIVPELCYRAAGRVDASSPILYEELRFDAEVQRMLSDHFKVPVQHSIFSFEEEIQDPEDRERICCHLNCAGFAQTAGQHLLLSKRRGLRIGCLKALLKHPEENRKVVVKEILEAFLNFPFS